jgi:hypothetical protein
MQTNQNTEAFIRKTGKNDSYVYNHEVRTFAGSERITKKRQISGREYIELLDQRHPGYKELKKFKQCFIFHNQYCMIETVINVDGQPSFLRFETSKESNKIEIPDFLHVLREVTSENNYASSSISKKEWKMPEEDKKLLTLARTKQPAKLEAVKQQSADRRMSPLGRKISGEERSPKKERDDLVREMSPNELQRRVSDGDKEKDPPKELIVLQVD